MIRGQYADKFECGNLLVVAICAHCCQCCPMAIALVQGVLISASLPMLRGSISTKIALWL
jgi:hypothetical protein